MVRVRVRPGHVEMSFEATHEIRQLGGGPLGIVVEQGLEAGKGVASSTGKDEDRPSDRVGQLALLEGAILHRREKVPEPTEFSASQGRIELVPEDQRDGAAQGDVPHLMEGLVQLRRPLELREIESEVPHPAFGKDRARELLHPERLPGTGRAEDRKGQRLVTLLGPVLEHQPAEAPIGFRLCPIERLQLPETGNRHPVKRGRRAFQHDLLGD